MKTEKRMLSLPLFPTLEQEKALWDGGYRLLAGLDEAGRGALAGPVVAAAVILPQDLEISCRLSGVRDSKLMTPLQRQYWALQIKQAALAWSIGSASHAEIDSAGIVPATKLAMLRALEKLASPPQYLLIDYLVLTGTRLPQKAIIKGDRLCLSIAAASVLAKTNRDELMGALDNEYPLYRFAKHKGYGTQEHRRLLAINGPSEIHRKTFQLKELLQPPLPV